LITYALLDHPFIGVANLTSLITSFGLYIMLNHASGERVL
jgi:hypothetical protein